MKLRIIITLAVTFLFGACAGYPGMDIHKFPEGSDVDLNTPIYAGFPHRLEAASITDATLVVREAEGQATLVSGELHYSEVENEGTITFIPAAPLNPNTTYVVAINSREVTFAQENTVEGLLTLTRPVPNTVAGSSLYTQVGQETVTWSFTTKSEPIVALPTDSEAKEVEEVVVETIVDEVTETITNDVSDTEGDTVADNSDDNDDAEDTTDEGTGVVFDIPSEKSPVDLGKAKIDPKIIEEKAKNTKTPVGGEKTPVETDTTCQVHADCGPNRICKDGECRKGECLSNQDCPEDKPFCIGELIPDSGPSCISEEIHDKLQKIAEDSATPEVQEETPWDSKTAVKSDSDKRVFLFARNSDDQLVQTVRRLDGFWDSKNVVSVDSNIHSDPVGFYNPTTGKMELFFVSEKAPNKYRIYHIEGKNGIWENANDPDFVGYGESYTDLQLLFHSNGDLYLFAAHAEDNNIVVRRWGFDPESGKTSTKNKMHQTVIETQPLHPDSTIAVVERPDGHVEIFSRGLQNQLFNYSSPGADDWGKELDKNATVPWTKGREQRIGYASIVGSPVAVVGINNTGNFPIAETYSAVWVFAKSNDDNTLDNVSPQAFGTMLYSWSWEQSNGWGNEYHTNLKNEDGSKVVNGHQEFMGMHYTPYAESMAAVYDSNAQKVKLFGTLNNASTKTVQQYMETGLYDTETVNSTKINGRLSAIYNPQSQEIEVFGRSADVPNSAVPGTPGPVIQFSYEGGTSKDIGEVISGNPVVIYNDWVE